MVMQYPTGHEFTFGETTVSPARRELIHQGKRVKLGNRAFDLLLLLLERRGAVVSKDQIMDVVWARRVVGENTLEGQMSILRRTLGADRTAIKTIAGRGYQFVGAMQSSCADTDASAEEVEAGDICARGVLLPAHVSPLIGRQTELHEVGDLLRSRRLVTLIGTGGVGKTHLAIEAARSVSACFDDGVFFAELAAIASNDFVPSAIAAALGFPSGDGSKNLEKILPGLRDRRFLLVIDNCEHVLDSAARIVDALLRIAPGATLFATSRESLRIAGEYVYRVPSLDVPCAEQEENACQFGAVQLLRERVASSFFATGDITVNSVMARICRRLDGIPLAIELAAACIPAFGLQGVADLLDDRFQLLRHGARTALPRQQTLRATVDWSYELLPEEWKTVLNRLSLFADAFTLESAQQLASSAALSPQAVTTAIAELVNKSLLCAIPGFPLMRYRLLETIRAYARERLQESGTHREWAEHHARHFLHVFLAAERVAPARTELDWDEAYGAHFMDLRTAVAWSFSPEGDLQTAVELTVASIAASIQTGLLEECLARVDAALAVLPSLRVGAHSSSQVDQWAMKLQAARGACLLFQNAGHQTSEAFSIALELAERNADVEYRMRGLWGNWICALLNGRPDEALLLASRFAKIASESHWATDQLVAQRLTAIARLYLGELDAARELLEHVLIQGTGVSRAERIRFLYDERMLAQAALSQSLSLLGLHDDARREAQRAVDDAEELEHSSSICYALSEAVCPIALLGGDNERLEDAVHALGEATRRHGAAMWKLRADMWRGLLELRAGCLDAYESVIAPALASIGNARYSIVLMPFIAETAISLAQHGKSDYANVLLDGSAEWIQRTDGILVQPELQCTGPGTLLFDSAGANVSQARYMLLSLVALSRQRGFVAWASRGANSLARLSERTGQSETAAPVPWLNEL